MPLSVRNINAAPTKIVIPLIKTHIREGLLQEANLLSFSTSVHEIHQTDGNTVKVLGGSGQESKEIKDEESSVSPVTLIIKDDKKHSEYYNDKSAINIFMESLLFINESSEDPIFGSFTIWTKVRYYGVQSVDYLLNNAQSLVSSVLAGKNAKSIGLLSTVINGNDDVEILLSDLYIRKTTNNGSTKTKIIRLSKENMQKVQSDHSALSEIVINESSIEDRVTPITSAKPKDD